MIRYDNGTTCRQKELKDRVETAESRLQEVNTEIRLFESDERGGGFSHRKEYASLEKQVGDG